MDEAKITIQLEEMVGVDGTDVDADVATVDHHLQLQALYAAESRLVYWDRVGWLVLVWIGYFSLTYVLYKANDLIRRCSTGWIVLMLMSIPYVGVITFFAGRSVHALMLRKLSLKYKFEDGDVRWEGDKLWKYPLLSFASGLVASMLGVGGGLVRGGMWAGIRLLASYLVPLSWLSRLSYARYRDLSCWPWASCRKWQLLPPAS